MKEVIILDSSSLRMSKDRSQSCVVYIINKSLRSSETELFPLAAEACGGENTGWQL